MPKDRAQRQTLLNQLMTWAAINSGSDNLPGLANMLAALEMGFSSLQGKMEKLPLPPRPLLAISGEIVEAPSGHALRITKRPSAPIQVLLAGHMDTVYPAAHPFQIPSLIDANTLRGPGVADMKGGLLIMLAALEKLEEHPAASNLGWEVIINPDEEIGSFSSEFLFKQAAQRNHLGLLFEPAYPDGAIVSSRKGSMNATLTARGRAAHAGRDFTLGRNAIAALAAFICRACRLNNPETGVTVNLGYISGGGPVNIVPDFAICRLNARAITPEDFTQLDQDLAALAFEEQEEGISIAFHKDGFRPPKIFDAQCRQLFERLNACAQAEGYSLSLRPSGGVCDGNLLAEAGLPVIDTLGAIGGNIHTSEEYLIIDSLIERSRLVSRFLIDVAQFGSPV